MTGQFVERSTAESLHFRLMSWFAAVALVVGIGAVAVGSPAFAARSGVVYQPHCYDTLCLSTDRAPRPGGGTIGPDFLVAWSRYDVGPTPYYISIFDTYSGERLGVCGWGTSCQAPLFGTQTVEQDLCLTFIAYIGGPSASMPPEPVQQTSATFTWCQPGG